MGGLKSMEIEEIDIRTRLEQYKRLYEENYHLHWTDPLLSNASNVLRIPKTMIILCEKYSYDVDKVIEEYMFMVFSGKTKMIHF